MSVKVYFRLRPMKVSREGAGYGIR